MPASLLTSSTAPFTAFPNGVSVGVIASTWTGAVIAGVQTAQNSIPGQVGEVQKVSGATYTNFTTTATYQALGSVAVTPGAYLVMITVTTAGNGATVTAGSSSAFALSTTAASATGAVEGDSLVYRQQDLATQGNDSISLFSEVHITVVTTYYLNAQMTFSAGNPQFVYSMRFQRIR